MPVLAGRLVFISGLCFLSLGSVNGTEIPLGSIVLDALLTLKFAIEFCDIFDQEFIEFNKLYSGFQVSSFILCSISTLLSPDSKLENCI